MSIILSANPHILYREIYQLQLWSSGTGSVSAKSSGGFGFGFNRNKNELKKRELIRAYGSFLPELSKPSTSTIEMEVIQNSEHLDQILEQAKQLSQPIAIDWMAAWCRKCIYLKPKFEKLAAEFDTKLKFYCVDVNNVPQTLVKRGNISKMPTIQIWKDGEMKAEVIGGHKAWLVIEEAREMIKLFV